MNVSAVLETPTIPNLRNWIRTGARKRAATPATLVGGPCGGVCSEFIHSKDEPSVELRLMTSVEDGREAGSQGPAETPTTMSHEPLRTPILLSVVAPVYDEEE